MLLGSILSLAIVIDTSQGSRENKGGSTQVQSLRVMEFSFHSMPFFIIFLFFNHFLFF